MMFLLVLVMSSVMTGVKVLTPEFGTTNLSFYLALLTLFLLGGVLCKDTFTLGWFKYTDETKVQLLFGLKSFAMVWVLLCYTDISD